MKLLWLKHQSTLRQLVENHLHLVPKQKIFNFSFFSFFFFLLVPKCPMISEIFYLYYYLDCHRYQPTPLSKPQHTCTSTRHKKRNLKCFFFSNICVPSHATRRQFSVFSTSTKCRFGNSPHHNTCLAPMTMMNKN